MRIFAGDRVRAIMDRLKMPDGEAIEAGIVTRSIESAQRKVEARNFDIRKQLLEYDDVANDQRKVIYQQRNEILEAERRWPTQIANLRESAMTDVVRTYVPAESVEEQWDLAGLEKVLRDEWQLELPLQAEVEKSDTITDEDIVEKVVAAADALFDAKVAAGRHRAVHARSCAWCCCSRSTATGASTWPRSTTCARASTCAATRRRTRSRNTSARPSSCSAQLLDVVKMEVTRLLMTVRIQSQEQVAQAAEAIEERASAGRQRDLHPPERGRQRVARTAGRRRASRGQPCPRSAATSPAPAAAARSTSTATASWPDDRRPTAASPGGTASGPASRIHGARVNARSCPST